MGDGMDEKMEHVKRGHQASRALGFQPWRQTGRTTAMIVDVERWALAGNRVLVLAIGRREAVELSRRFEEHTRGSMLDIRKGGGAIAVGAAPLLDEESWRTRTWHVVAIDHVVWELDPLAAASALIALSTRMPSSKAVGGFVVSGVAIAPKMAASVGKVGG